jgi:hypothetical protein
MFQGYKVVSVTPAGRQRYLELLSRYLLRERDIIDHHEWWVNTTVQEDIAYLDLITRDNPDFFKLVYSSEAVPDSPEGRLRRINQWYPRLTDVDTIYIKFDDDIVYIAPGAIHNLLEYRIKNKSPFLVYPCIVNNPCITHVLQRQGAIPLNHGPCDYHSHGLGWRDGAFAEMVHRSFLRSLSAGQMVKWTFGEFHVMYYERISINCVVWFGRDFAQFRGEVSGDDEHFLSCSKPAELSRPNVIYGKSIVAHFSFAPQNQYLDGTDLLNIYRSLPSGVSQVKTEALTQA